MIFNYTTSSLSHSNEESDFEGFLTSQENDHLDNKPSLVKLNAPKNMMECEEIATATNGLKISDNSLIIVCIFYQSL